MNDSYDASEQFSEEELEHMRISSWDELVSCLVRGDPKNGEDPMRLTLNITLFHTNESIELTVREFPLLEQQTQDMSPSHVLLTAAVDEGLSW